MSTIRFKVALWVGASALVFATQAFAQQAGAQQAPDAKAAPDKSGTVAEVVITGTRTVRNGYAQPTPVTVATTEELAKAVPSDLPDALNALPQFENSSSPSRSTHNFTSSAENGNILNLRGVGGDRTLILFDGQRMPPTTFLGETDVDVLPQLLVKRVDIVTGGASAIYGSDAVAGVVNFVLDRGFTGVQGVVQGGTSQQGDNSNYRIGIAAGAKVLNDKGHVLFSFEDYHNDGMLRSARANGTDDYIYAGATPGSTYASGSPQNPYKIYEHASIGIASPTGLITNGPGAFTTQLSSTGAIIPFVAGNPTGTPGYNTNGDGFSIPSNVTANAPIDTKKGYARFSYDLTPDITAFVQGVYSHSELNYVLEANGFLPPTQETLYSGNPFISSALQNYITTNNLGSASVWQYPIGPNPNTTETTDFYMITAGLEGKFWRGWTWNLTYDHSHSDENVQQKDTLNWRNAYAALDVVTGPNGPTCNVLLNPTYAAQYAGCQPLNTLNPSQAALNYVLGTSKYDAQVTQDNVAGSVQGSVFQLPAGPVVVAVGGEYRTQSLNLTSNSNPALLETPQQQAAYFAGLRGVPPGTLAYWVTDTGIASASENVYEGFGELSVPVLKDMPFAKSLDLNLAGRVTQYSTSGTAKTWKLGATWRPIQDLLFRIGDSQDIRAPNLYELYAGAQSGVGQLYDPVTNTTNNVTTITEGNSKLQPEIGSTFTAGGVVSPRFLPGLSVSIDYYRLDITGAVGTLSAQQIVNNCYANASAPECALITRPTPGAFPSLIQVSPANTSFLKTSGLDFDGSYRTRLFDNPLSVRVYANYLGHYITQQSSTAPVYENSGYGIVGNQPIAYPKWRGTLFVDYKIHAWDVFVSEQYIDGFSLNSPQIGQFQSPDVGVIWYTNATISYNMPVHNGHIETFFTVSNLFDQQPPLIPGTIPGLNLPTIISLYDTVGRAFTAGARFKF
jgi:outer membrane receptor protein involved in Fe transport